MLERLENEWEFDVLGVRNYNSDEGSLRFYFDFVKENLDEIDGDIVEAGVFRGNSLVAMGLMLKQMGSSKKVYGFDSFSGFPPIYHQYDHVETFEKLYARSEITLSHIESVRKNISIRNFLQAGANQPQTMSSSGDFSGTSKELVLRKIEALNLDNIVLIDGPFDKTMQGASAPENIMAVLMDCDLYESYRQTFDFAWPRLSSSGLVYLDEYYSLKFPGARVATNSFVEASKNAELVKFPSRPCEFERWGLVKR